MTVSANNTKNIYCSKYPNSGPYVISISFTETNTNVSNNTSTLSLNGSIQSTGISWDSNYDHYLKLYWYDNYTQKETLVATSSPFQDLNTNEKVSVSGTIHVTHKDDGSLNGYATCKYVSGSTSGGYAPNSSNVSTANIELTKIARASSISSIVGDNLGENIIVNISRVVDSYIHKVEWKIGDSSYVTSSENSTTSNSFIPDLSYASYYPNSNQVVLTVRITTFNGTVQIGNSIIKTKTLKIPELEGLKPTFDLTTTRIDNGVPSDWNVYVQGYSKCQLDIVNASGIYGASITSYSITGAGLTSTESSVTTGILNQLNYTFKAIVTDSRGRSQTKEISIQVEKYSLPSLSLEAKRCLSDGTISSAGTYLYVTFIPTISSISNKNTYSKKVTCNGVSNTTFTSQSFVLDANCSIGSTYIVSASITDALNNTTSLTTKIPTSERVMNVKSNKKGIAFGGFSEEDEVMKSFWPLKVEGDIYSKDTKVSLDGHNHSNYALSTHTHNYAASTSAGGAASSVANALTISLNDTSQGAYNGSASKSINITPSSIGAATASHTHSYSPLGANTTNGSCVSLWSGSDKAPSFTVSNITQYKYFLVQCGDSSSAYATWIFIPYSSSYVTTSFRGIGGYETTSSTNGGEIQFIRGTISSSTITIASAWLRKTATITSNSSTTQLYVKRVVGVK